MQYKVDPIKTLEGLKENVYKRILRVAMREASNEVKADVKSSLPSVTGGARKSVGVKISARKRYTVTAVVGSRADYKRGEYRPSRAVSILEFGSKHIDARHYVRNAYNPTRYNETVRRRASEEIAKSLPK